MSLTLSLRVGEGIVLAADSLLVVPAKTPPREEFIKCPKCATRIPSDKFFSREIPISISSNAAKLFCIKKRDIGVASFGRLFIADKSLGMLLFEFENLMINSDEPLEYIVEKLLNYLKAEVENYIDLSTLAPDEYYIGLQVAGYDKENPRLGKTYLVKIGKVSNIEPVHLQGYGCTFGGDGRVIQRLWKEEASMPPAFPNFAMLSLADAIDYAEFLMTTTVQYQRFAPMVPSCGGNIDICVITPAEGFRWIKHKELPYQDEFV